MISVSLYHWEQIWLISLSSPHLRLDSTDHNQSPSGSPSSYLFFSLSQPNLYIISTRCICIFLLFIVAPHSSYVKNTFLSYTLPHSNGALWEYTLYAKGVSVGLVWDSVVISVHGYVCVCLCVYVGRWVCVREHLQRDQPWGCRCIAAVKGEQRGWRRVSSQQM